MASEQKTDKREWSLLIHFEKERETETQTAKFSEQKRERERKAKQFIEIPKRETLSPAFNPKKFFLCFKKCTHKPKKAFDVKEMGGANAKAEDRIITISPAVDTM